MVYRKIDLLATREIHLFFITTAANGTMLLVGRLTGLFPDWIALLLVARLSGLFAGWIVLLLVVRLTGLQIDRVALLLVARLTGLYFDRVALLLVARLIWLFVDRVAPLLIAGLTGLVVDWVALLLVARHITWKTSSIWQLLNSSAPNNPGGQGASGCRHRWVAAAWEAGQDIWQHLWTIQVELGTTVIDLRANAVQ